MILIVYGTRPEYIKIKPLIVEMTKELIPFKTLFTGQHKDIVNSYPDFTLNMENNIDNRLDSIIVSCMGIPDYIFEGIKYVLVQGDTTSVVGLALSAMHRKIKIIHLEAGLRTHDTDNPYPEEFNRRIVSSIANIHLSPTRYNKENLIREGISPKSIHVVGNTGLDNLADLRDNIEYKNTVLVTLHRRENHDNIDKWFTEINRLAGIYNDHEFILPIHPNPNVQKYRHLLTNINVVDPLPHEELVKQLLSVKLVITDSGGLQEECSFLKKYCIVCRKITERPESVNYTSYLVDDPNNLESMFKWLLFNPKPILELSPFGNGHASEKICKIFKALE